MSGHTPWKDIQRKKYGGPAPQMDCICTVDQVKSNMHDPGCEWCNAGFDCNPDLSDAPMSVFWGEYDG